MSSRRDRSPSPRPHKKRRHERSPTPSDYSEPERPAGVPEISEEDYFVKNEEFKVWLKEEKRKYFDELSGEKARSYFKKFVKAWNRGHLSKSLYSGVNSTSTSSASQTSFKWAFAEKSNRSEREALERARGEVGSLTYGRSAREEGPSRVSGPSMPPRVAGPTLPSAGDIRLAREEEEESRSKQRGYDKRLDKKVAKERVEDMLGPREVGKEALLEKKRAKREGDRSFRDAKEDDGGEVGEDVLMGGDSFQERLRQRDAAKSRFGDKRQQARLERDSELQEKTRAMRAKESETMAMFQKLAKERFG